jgi:hypothetical protein
MGRLSLAWKILTDTHLAERCAALLAQPADSPPSDVTAARAATPDVAAAVSPLATGRSEALTLLADLQREGRLLDFLKEPIESYSDAQVGAAVRAIHRDCAAVVERQFAVRPVIDQPEGSAVDCSRCSPAQVRITGNSGNGGNVTLMHNGWKATQCELPRWTGSADDSLILAPAEAGESSR